MKVTGPGGALAMSAWMIMIVCVLALGNVYFPFNDTMKLAATLICLGAAGGLLRSIKANDGLLLPGAVKSVEGKRVIHPGYLGDMLFGMAGGLLLFVVIPGTVAHTEPEEWMKLWGLALVLGYAGPTVVSSIAERQLREISGAVNESQREIEQQKTERDARVLLDQYLDLREPVTRELTESLRSALRASSPQWRYFLFREAERAREKKWKPAARSARRSPEFGKSNEKLNGQNEELLSRIGAVFDMIAESPDTLNRYRVVASRGYVYRDLNEPEKAVETLNRALALAGESGASPHAGIDLALAMAHLDALAKRRVLFDPGSGERKRAGDINLSAADREIIGEVNRLLTSAVQKDDRVRTLLKGVLKAREPEDVERYDLPLWWLKRMDLLTLEL